LLFYIYLEIKYKIHKTSSNF